MPYDFYALITPDKLDEMRHEVLEAYAFDIVHECNNRALRHAVARMQYLRARMPVVDVRWPRGKRK